MLAGEEFTISGGGYEAVVVEGGAALRALTYDGRALLDGFDAGAMAFGGRGQILMPWPNRIRDGRYTVDGRDLQLPLSEVARGHASHGLVRWVAWTREEHTDHSVSLQYRLMAQPGYPWSLDLHVLYDLSADGLTVTQTATNVSTDPAPYASGAHPYLSLGSGPVDGWKLSLSARTRSVVDDRLIPVGREPVAGSEFDFSTPRPIGDVEINHAFTDLHRDARGIAEVTLRDPAGGHGLSVWLDRHHRWVQLYTADDAGETARRSIAIEPMTANANAFATGEDVVTLAAAGAPGDELSATWGVRAVDRAVDEES